jgi:hypothetical protein
VSRTSTRTKTAPYYTYTKRHRESLRNISEDSKDCTIHESESNGGGEGPFMRKRSDAAVGLSDGVFILP